MNRHKKFLLALLSGCVLFLSTPMIAWAANSAPTETQERDCGILAGLGDGCSSKIRNGKFDINDIPNIIKGATDIVLGFAAFAALLAVLVGGFRYAYEQEKSKAKDTITTGIIGFIVATSSWFIITVVINTLTNP